MLFKEVTARLLSKPNCALLIGGALWIEDLHNNVRVTAQIVGKIKDPHNSTEAKMLKDQLIRILENYDTARRLPVGSRRPRK